MTMKDEVVWKGATPLRHLEELTEASHGDETLERHLRKLKHAWAKKRKTKLASSQNAA